MKIKWKIILSTIGIITLLILSNIFFSFFEVKKIISTETKDEIKNYSNLGLALIEEIYPGDWKANNGILYKGNVVLNENYKVLDEITKNTDILATIFLNDTRISTNVVNSNNERQINTQASEDVINTVLKNGEPYVGVAKIEGKSAQTYYIPLKNSNNEIIGMWFVGVYTDVVNQNIMSTMKTLVFISIILLIVGVIISFYLGNSISKGIVKIKEKLSLMENGNFSFEFDKALIKRKDEVGLITNSALKMKNKICEIIHQIQNESDNLKTMTKDSVIDIEEVNENIQDISATTEELSAGMDETSAATEEVNASISEVENKISNMKEMTYQGEQLALEIKNRAEQLKTETEASYENASNIYEATNKQLRESIEKAKAIDKIKELSQTILEITAQTNLLALNAAIEAARAGEAGRGFAVVADEIRVLSENSSNTVTKINDITAIVSETVSSVVADSKNLLEFVDNQVLNDYKMLVNSSIQYNNDADKVNNVVTEINSFAEESFETIQQIHEAIDEITTSTVQGATETTDIVDKISNIALKATEVLQRTKNNQEGAVKLDEMIDFFSI